MNELYILIHTFLEKYTLLGYVSFCLVATFIVVTLFCPRKKISLERSSVQETKICRLNNIDFLKILLTYMIVLHHEFQALNIPNEAHNCVELFFIISGFMLVYNYKEDVSIKEFIRKKIVCFFPYLFLGDMLALCLFQHIDISALFAGVFMYADTGLYNKFSVYAPSWYLISLFWGLIFYLSMMKVLSKEVCNFVIGIVAFVCWSAMANIGLLLSINEYLPLLTNGQVRALSCISIGYFIGINYKYVKECKPTIFYTLVEVCLLLGLLTVLFVAEYKLPIYLIVILFIFLFWSFLHQKGFVSGMLDKINWSPFARYMLPIFMSHWVITMLQQNGRLWNGYSVPLQLFLALFCSTLLGVVAYHIVHLAYFFQRIRD